MAVEDTSVNRGKGVQHYNINISLLPESAEFDLQ